MLLAIMSDEMNELKKGKAKAKAFEHVIDARLGIVIGRNDDGTYYIGNIKENENPKKEPK